MGSLSLFPDEMQKVLKKIAPWGARIWYVRNLDDSSSYEPVDDRSPVDIKDPMYYLANAVSSQTDHPTMQAVVLDIDMDAALVPTSTPGHYTLFINKLLPQEDWILLMQTLAQVGIIEPGYASASVDRGMSFARLPWVGKKGTTPSPRTILHLLQEPLPATSDQKILFRAELEHLLSYYRQDRLSGVPAAALAEALDQLIPILRGLKNYILAKYRDDIANELKPRISKNIPC